MSSGRSLSAPFFRLLAVVAVAAFSAPLLLAQQTFGGITGTVSDSSGGIIAGATIKLVEEHTGLSREATTNASGEYLFPNLPIGDYLLTYTREGFETQKLPHIPVQGQRTATLNVQLKPGATSTTIEVQETPLLNAVDTTNGYILERAQIDSIPLPTGSFTGLAILSPGVNAELTGGTGANTGLGNAPIWANGQRDTSNSFLLNGVDASNLFNGKSTSQVTSDRVVLDTGEGNSNGGGVMSIDGRGQTVFDWAEMSPATSKYVTAFLADRGLSRTAPRRITPAPSPQVKARAQTQAQNFEGMFLNSMFSQMTSGLKGEGPFGNTVGTGIWRSMQIEQYSKSFAQAGGVGIAKEVYRTLIMQQAKAANQSQGKQA